MAFWTPAFHSELVDREAMPSRQARRVLRDLCAESHVSSETTDTALLLLSELITNAVTHGAGNPILEIDLREQHLRITVTDIAPGTPQIQRHGADPAGTGRGRGLLLVDELSARWGTRRYLPTGKSVWFELDHP